MDPWAEARLRARACHAEAHAEAAGDRSAAALMAAAARLRDIEVVPFEPGTRFDHGILGVYERVGLLISVDASLAPGNRELVVAHELGHHELDDVEVAAAGAVADAGPCDTDREMGLARAGAAHQYSIALMSQEFSTGEIAHQHFVDGRPLEAEVLDVLGQG